MRKKNLFNSLKFMKDFMEENLHAKFTFHTIDFNPIHSFERVYIKSFG